MRCLDRRNSLNVPWNLEPYWSDELHSSQTYSIIWCFDDGERGVHTSSHCSPEVRSGDCGGRSLWFTSSSIQSLSPMNACHPVAPLIPSGFLFFIRHLPVLSCAFNQVKPYGYHLRISNINGMCLYFCHIYPLVFFNLHNVCIIGFFCKFKQALRNINNRFSTNAL